MVIKKKKPSPKKVHRVYCTYFDDGKYYIGYSSKTDRLFEKYFGSSSYVTAYEGEMRKEIVAVFDSKSHAKMQEFLLQWQCRFDENCINSMLNIRLRREHLSSFTPVAWEPSNDF